MPARLRLSRAPGTTLRAARCPHVVIVWVVPESPRGIAGGPRVEWLEAGLEPTPLTPNAPRGDLGSSGEPHSKRSPSADPARPETLTRRASRATGPPPSSGGSTTGDKGAREDRVEVALEGAHVGASGDEGAGGLSSDAFLDALLARGGGATGRSASGYRASSDSSNLRVYGDHQLSLQVCQSTPGFVSHGRLR